MHFKGNKLRVSSAFPKLPIAFRQDAKVDGCYDVSFCHHRFMQLDLTTLKTVALARLGVSYVSAHLFRMSPVQHP